MKRKLLALSMFLFLLGTTGSIYFLPTQEALFVAKGSMQQSLQEIAKEFSTTLRKPQLRTTTVSVQEVVKMLEQFLGITAGFIVTIQILGGALFQYKQAFVYFTPHKAKKLKRFRDDIL